MFSKLFLCVHLALEADFDCDSIVREAMNLYWNGKPWHFFKTNVVEKLSQDSVVIKRLTFAFHELIKFEGILSISCLV